VGRPDTVRSSRSRRFKGPGVAGIRWNVCCLTIFAGVLLASAGSRQTRQSPSPASRTLRAFDLSSDPTQNIIMTIAGTGGSGLSGDGGPALLASISPFDVAVDASGNLFISNAVRVRKIGPDGIISTVAGTGGFGFSGDGGPAAAAQIQPLGIAVDSAGDLFIADTNNQRIRKVAPNGVITTIAGNGTNGFSGDGGPGVAAQLSFPTRIALDGAGNVFISDTSNNRIRKLTPSGVISTVAGNGSRGFSGDGGAATAAQFFNPTGIAVDNSGNLFIADNGNTRVRMVNGSGVISTIAGTGIQGLGGDGGSALSAQLYSPTGIALDGSGNLYICDNFRVRMINGAGMISTVAGNGLPAFYKGDGGPAIAAQLQPASVAIDGSGALLIADSGNERIRRVRPLNPGLPVIMSMVPSTGIQGTTISAKITGTNLATATAVSFSGVGVTGSISSADSASITLNITISPNAPLGVRTVSVTTTQGQSDFFAGFGIYPPPDNRVISAFAGTGTNGFAGDGALATNAQLSGPAAVAIDKAGNVFIADFFNNRIREVSPAGTITTVVGNGSAGFSGDGGPAALAALNGPRTVVIDGSGNLLIADAHNNRIRKVNSAGTITTIAGNGTSAFAGDGGPATAASLSFPDGLALDSVGNLFIGDSGNNRVRVVGTNGVINTVAGSDAQGFSGDGGPANTSALFGPSRVCVSPLGDLFIDDVGNNRVRKVNSDGIISTVAGNGQGGTDPTEGSPATEVPVVSFAISCDPAGDLLIADLYRIRRVDLSGNINTVVGQIYPLGGGPANGGDGGPAILAALGQSNGIAVDIFGNLFIADYSNNRVRVVSANSSASGTASPQLNSISTASGVQGTTVSATLSGFNLAGANAVIFSGTGISATILSGGNNLNLPISISIAPGAGTGARSVTVMTATAVSNSLPGFAVNASPAPQPPAIGVYIDGTPTMTVVTARQGTTSAVMLSGAHLTGASAVSFSGSGVTATILPGGTDSALPIVIYVDPTAPVGGYTFTVTTSVGTTAPVSGFSVVPGVAGDVISMVAGRVFQSIQTALGIAVDPAGNVFFADSQQYSGHARIAKIDPFGVLSTVVSGVNPGAVASDSQGNIYFVDFGTYEVRKISPSGSVTTVAGNGVEGFSGDGGPAISAQLLSPWSVAVDSSGNVFIGDWSRIRMVNSAGVINTIAGTGTGGFSGDGGPAALAQLGIGLPLAIDSANNLFIADYGNNRIRMVNPAGIISTVAGNGMAADSGDGGPATSAQVASPWSVAVDRSENLYIGDLGIRVVDSSGNINKLGPAASPLPNSPSGIATDPTGDIWITGSSSVQEITRGVPPSPSISSISPSSAAQGATFSATISGSHLSGAAAVVFSGVGVTATINPGGTDSSIPVSITIDPAAPSGARPLTIVTRNSISAATSGFSVNVSGLPRITSISSTAATQGDVQFATISGANFTGATAVTFDGTGASATISAGGNDTTLPVTITVAPNASTGLRRFTVSTPSGTSAAFSGLTINPSTPAISLLSVSSGVQGAAVSATITGTNLIGVTSIAFSGAGVSAVISGTATATSLPITISISAAAPTGPRTVTVGTPDRISAPFSGFAVSAGSVPLVTMISPSIGLSGTTISGTITGSRLTGATALAFTGSGVTAAINGTGTDTQLPVAITVAPGTAPGQRSLSVTTPGGVSAPFNGFTVQAGNPIRVLSVSTISIMQGSAFSLTVFGENLGGATGITFSGDGITAAVAGGSTSSVQITGNVAMTASLGLRTLIVTTPAGSSDPFDGLRVLSIPRSSLITSLMGNGLPGYSGDGYNAAELSTPAGVALDAAGNLFIADSQNNRVRKLTPDRVVSTVAGTGVLGSAGDGGPATAATLNSPGGVLVDSAGNLFIADTSNHRVRKVSPAGVITNVAGTGAASFGGDGGLATNAALNSPNSIAIDSKGNLFIADTGNNRIRKVGLDGLIQTIAGTGVPGFSGDGGDATAARLNAPAGIAIDSSGNVLIADFNNSCVREISVAGSITRIAGTGSFGSSGDGGPATSALLSLPIDVKVDAIGNILIADYFDQRIRRVNSAGIISTVAGVGGNRFSGDGGLATSATLFGPAALAVDSAGDFLVADSGNNRVREVTVGGVITTVLGNSVAGFNGDGPAALFAQSYVAQDVAVDAAGNVYVADTGNNRIRKLTPSGVVSTVAGNGVGGGGGDGGPATSALLNTPVSVTVDGVGNILISDSLNYRIRRVTPDGIISTVAGTGTSGFSGDGGPASVAQIRPAGIATDAAGDLFIADTLNARVRMVNASGVITTVAGNGLASFSGDGGSAVAAGLNNPSGVTTDAFGNLFIADSNNQRVRKVNNAGVISTFAGSGTAGFSGDDDLATLAWLNNPKDVAVDANGNVFISDFTARVRMVDTTGVITTVAGNGIPGFSGDGGQATSAQVAPSGIAVDGNGNLLIVGDNRVRKVTFTNAVGVSSLSGIFPFSGKQGTVLSATISGSLFTGASSVSFSGTGVTGSVGSGATATNLPVTITIAADAVPGLRLVNVTTPAGTSSGFSGFTVSNVVVRPLLASISPSKGIIGTSFSAAINGTALTGATGVSFSGSGVTAAILSGGTDSTLPITITVASNASLDLRTFTVTTPGGTSPAFNGFTVVRPTITGISPSTGTVGFSIAATINGSNLSGASAVTFSGTGVAAAISAGATDTMVPIMVTVAPGAAAVIRDVTVITTSATSVPFTGFTINALGPSGMITTFAGDGTTDFKGDGGPAIAAGLYGPENVATDAAGNVYIADRNHNVIRKVTPSGVISTVVGNGSNVFSGDGGPATAAAIGDPAGIAVDRFGNLLIVDRDNSRIRKVTPDGIINTVAGNGIAGFLGDGGPAVSAEINSSIGLAVDGAGAVYIADFINQRIRKVDTNGIITTVAGNGSLGFSGDGGAATSAQLAYPTGVAVDASGNIFIADRDNQRIRMVSPAGIITTIASGLYPASVTLDNSGSLLVADPGSHQILKIDSAGIVSTIAGSGDFIFGGDGGPAINAGMNPSDVAVDTNGNLFIADAGSNRVRKVSYSATRKGRGQITSQ
jgi:mucin-19